MKKGTTKIWGYKLSRKSKKVKKKKKKSSETWSGAKVFVPHAVWAFITIAVIASSSMFFRHYFLNSETFRIKHVLVNKSSMEMFRNGQASLDNKYIGRNIFSVVPSQVEILLRGEYPHLKLIRVMRVFPDTIEIDLVSRESFACLDTEGGVIVDRGGMILSVGDTPDNLVLIEGVNFFLSRPKPGIILKDRSVQDALGVIDSILGKVRIRRGDFGKVDVSDRSNIWVTIKGVSINLGKDDFSKKADILGEILSDPKINLSGISYIDLRFKDPVYSYKRN